MERNKVLILTSGGLDSSVLLALYTKLNYEVHTLYVNYGNNNLSEETKALENLCERFSIPKKNMHWATVKMTFNNSNVTGDGTDPYVSMRNLILGSLAISRAEDLDIPEVAFGFIDVPEPYKDSDDCFIANLNVLSVETCGIYVKAPLLGLNKQQVYDLGKSLGIELRDIFSCFTPVDGVPCGKCLACKDLEDLT